MLTTVISISDDDWVIILLIVGLCLLMGSCFSMISLAKAKQESDERSSHETPTPQPPTPPQQSVPTWKRIEMEAAQNEQTAHKCIFCGAGMSETQVFCGSCGRRKD